MAREKSYILQALNISFIEHSKSKYEELFSKIEKIKEPIKLRGNTYILPSRFEKYDDDLLCGRFYNLPK